MARNDVNPEHDQWSDHRRKRVTVIYFLGTQDGKTIKNRPHRPQGVTTHGRTRRPRPIQISQQTRLLSSSTRHKLTFCITDGRIPFWGPKATSSPDDGHVYFGDNPQSFWEAFKTIGTVVRLDNYEESTDG